MRLASKIKARIGSVGNFLLDLFFPRFCFSCKKEGYYICSNCSLFLSESSFICPVCEKSSYLGKRHNSCSGKDHPEGVISVWDYEGIAKNAIDLAKDNLVICPLEEMIDNFLIRLEENKERLSLFFSFLMHEDTVITFVPACSKREVKRGFDQAREVAKILSKKTGKKTKKLLYRERQVKSQTGLNRKEREENVRDAFKLITKKSLPSKIVIVDDIWTSGSTIRECVKTLKKSGVEEVWGFTLVKKP